ncbi:MAG: hypothetical protein AB7O57_17520 [Hyphomicrobiaceae bacterium]
MVVVNHCVGELVPVEVCFWDEPYTNGQLIAESHPHSLIVDDAEPIEAH